MNWDYPSPVRTYWPFLVWVSHPPRGPFAHHSASAFCSSGQWIVAVSWWGAHTSLGASNSACRLVTVQDCFTVMNRKGQHFSSSLSSRFINAFFPSGTGPLCLKPACQPPSLPLFWKRPCSFCQHLQSLWIFIGRNLVSGSWILFSLFLAAL